MIPEADPVPQVDRSNQAFRNWVGFLSFVFILIVLGDFLGLKQWLLRWFAVIILAIGGIKLLFKLFRWSVRTRYR
jgi:hypothetical protein